MSAPSAAERRFRALFESEHRAVLRYALSRTNGSADAADILAETFLVAWRRLDDVPPGREAKPWLLAVARRVIANWRRAGVRRNGLADRLREELAASPSVVSEDRRTTQLHAALERLDEDDQELLRLTSWDELAPVEIAGVMGLPAGTVRTRLHRARSRLRQELDGDGSGEPAGASPNQRRTFAFEDGER